MKTLLISILVLISLAALYSAKSVHLQKRAVSTLVLSGGTYKDMSKEKRRLLAETGFQVSGTTHEFEHIVGVGALLHEYADETERSTGLGKEIQDAAPAYFEVKELHRKHVGTGSSKAAAAYRELVYGLISSDKLGESFVLNQEEYRKLPEFQKYIGSQEEIVATNSYNNMIKQNPIFYYLDSNGNKIALKLNRDEQIKAYIARQNILKGISAYKEGTKTEITAARKFLGV